MGAICFHRPASDYPEAAIFESKKTGYIFQLMKGEIEANVSSSNPSKIPSS